MPKQFVQKENLRAKEYRKIKAERSCFFCKTKSRKRFKFVHHNHHIVFVCFQCQNVFGGKAGVIQILEKIPLDQSQLNFFTYKRAEPSELEPEQFKNPFIRGQKK